MPQLGETWSMGEMVAAATAASGRLEAIVLATGPSRIRLITRTGRRITAPVSSWDRVWHFVRPAPPMHQRCEREGCSQEAFFRYYPSPDRVSWVCDDHLPHGVAALFPGDANEMPDTRLSCVFCGGSTTQEGVIHLFERATVRLQCRHCLARWCPLVSRGLGDDGTILARDIHGLRTLTTIPFLEVRMGYRSYRDLCRALGVGSTLHIDGLPIFQDTRLEDQLALALERRPEGRDLLEGQKPTPVTAEGPPRCPLEICVTPIEPGSLWRRRHPRWQAVVRVSNVDSHPDGDVVHHSLTAIGVAEKTGYPSEPLFQSRADFLRYWAPLAKFDSDEVSLPLEVGTVWCHRETRRIVQLKEPTPTHVANSQVSYTTMANEVETTPAKTFLRLYSEVPTPPEDHLWVRAGEVFTVTREEDRIHLQRHLTSADQTLNLVEFFETFDALSFITRYDHRNTFLDTRDPRGALIGGNKWHDDQGGVEVIDVGSTWSGSEFVRYRRDAAEHLMPVSEFVAQFRYEPPNVPCADGETWVHRENDEMTVTIVEVQSLRDYVTIEDVVSSVRYELRIAELTRYYRRLDIRSYWEVLEAEDEDASGVAQPYP